MIGLIDCDNFFCSCERVFRPDLAGRPVVVLSNNDGCVVARSRESKAMGIPEGMPYYQMRQQWGDDAVVAFSSNYTLYGDMSARVMAVLRDAVPNVVQYSIDEAFLNLEGMAQLHNLKQWGEELCARVEQWTGIPVSLGIAPTKTLAKAASRFAKKYPGYRKCCVIATGYQQEAALKLLGIADVWGIGRRMCRAMRPFGIATAYDFASLPQSWVRCRFHVTGERVWRELHGENAIDIDAMDGVEKKSIMTSRSFPGMVADIAALRAHVANYAARCAMKLRRQHSVCSVLMVFVQSNHFREDLPDYDNSASVSFATPTSATPQLVAAAIRVLDSVFRDGIHYKRAGVMVSGISDDGCVQPDLFSFDHGRHVRLRKVSQALDLVNSRMGADTVVLAAQQYQETDAGGRALKFAGAIRRDLKSPDYTTTLGAFRV